MSATLLAGERGAARPEVTGSSYRQILKSSAIVGGSQAATVGIGIVRTKIIALLLGPSGYGLFGLYNSIYELTQLLVGLGVNSSGVRQIAEAAASGDNDRIAVTGLVLRRVCSTLALAGAFLLAVFSNQVAELTFGNRKHASAVVILSLALFFRLIASGQGALIQGMRRMSDLARMNVLGASLGTLTSLPLLYVFGTDGIAPSIAAAAAMTIGTSCWYARKVEIPRTHLTLGQIRAEAAPMIRLGIAFMVTSLMTMGSAYVTRLLILRRLGFAETGCYQSAWTLGGLYVSFILQAMGADFYPRLTAAAGDDTACNRMVNEQAQVGTLLALPGAIATLSLTPFVISVFYDSKFLAAVEVLRWICLGSMLQVITWPMGFISVAKAKTKLFFWSDFAWTIVYLGLSLFFIEHFGLNGAGMAFFGSYIFHAGVSYAIARSLTKFRWSAENRRVGLLSLPLTASAFLMCQWGPSVLSSCVGTVLFAFAATYSAKKLASSAAWRRPLRFQLRQG